MPTNFDDKKQITCYLDSQDYSALTDPKTLTTDLLKIRDALTNFAREGTVQFVYSFASISEAVAISPDASHLAERKAELLNELCGKNALVFIDRLINSELKALSTRCDSLGNMIDPCGNWFPDISVSDTMDTPWTRMRQLAEDDLKTMGLSRQQRRAAASKMIKNGKPRGDFKSHIAQQNASLLTAEIIKQYPMKLEYAEMMTRYTLGRATEEEFTMGLVMSLRDPSWMMKWFTTNHEMASPISEMVRKPGRELGWALRKLVEISEKMASSLLEGGLDDDPLGKRGEISCKWVEMQRTQMVGLVQSVAIAQGVKLHDISAEDVDKYCPGFSAMIRSLYSSVWLNVVGARKEMPSDSQPVDSLHAIYAPYVNVFRADRFMSPHIQKEVFKHGTIVVPRLTNLVDALKIELQRTV